MEIGFDIACDILLMLLFIYERVKTQHEIFVAVFQKLILKILETTSFGTSVVFDRI